SPACKPILRREMDFRRTANYLCDRKGSVLYDPPLEPASGGLQLAEQLSRLACGLAERKSSRAGPTARLRLASRI
ncbi:MAG TPA: hypothetical protein VNZ03_10540, partial [Terriglobales bacterium]|nr:hypothetical protein [Terriglobales bacterium]